MTAASPAAGCLPATQNLQPQLAGTASGVLNTIQELGVVIASAV
jgi:hypothetical protein